MPLSGVQVLDVNVWAALVIEGHPKHADAVAWLEDRRETESVRFCRATQQRFLRLLTSAVVFAPFGREPLTNEQAWEAFQALLADHRIAFTGVEPAGLDVRWREFGSRAVASPKLWADAYLAAFVVAADQVLVSTDETFKLFPGLRLRLI